MARAIRREAFEKVRTGTTSLARVRILRGKPDNDATQLLSALCSKKNCGCPRLYPILTQIWIALCTYLLLAYLKFSAKLDASLQEIMRLLQLNLFLRRDLLDLLSGKPPDPQPDYQRALPL